MSMQKVFCKEGKIIRKEVKALIELFGQSEFISAGEGAVKVLNNIGTRNLTEREASLCLVLKGLYLVMTKQFIQADNCFYAAQTLAPVKNGMTLMVNFKTLEQHVMHMQKNKKDKGCILIIDAAHLQPLLNSVSQFIDTNS